MISKSLLLFIYDAASMQRWNDHIRPHKGFTELDKQAHKMMFAYVLAKIEEADRKTNVNWRHLIEGGIFEFFHRIMLTDIKPPIFHQLMSKHRDRLNEWILHNLKDKGVYSISGDFIDRMRSYLFDEDYCPLEKKILRASHYLATNWEFEIVYRMSVGFYGLDETKESIANQLEEHYDLAGVQKLTLGRKTRSFLDLVGQLRFQQRWAQSPRIPETSVLGHMLIVAVLSYLFSIELGGCEKRLYNNFFGGLFHDLPEVLTRDIISPVKNSMEELSSLIKEIEDRQVEERILPLLPETWHNEIQFFTRDEFTSKISLDNIIKQVSSQEISEKYNNNLFNPIDGQIIEVCDKLAAFIEARLSIRYGITSHYLKEGSEKMYEAYRNKSITGINFGALFNDFM